MARQKYFEKQAVICKMTYRGKYPVEASFNQRTLQLAFLSEGSNDQNLISDSRAQVCRQYEDAVKKHYGICLSVTWEDIESGCVDAPSTEEVSV